MPYRDYNVLDKWLTPSFDDRTRDVVEKRIGEAPPRRFFTAGELSLLTELAELLLALDPTASENPPIALWIDEQLYDNRREGYRREGVPPLQEAWRIGLSAIDAEAWLACGDCFFRLDPKSKRALLRAIQQGKADSLLWRGLDPASFFSEILLKTVAGLFYTHPLAWNEIGFGGPASPRGYVRLGFNARDPWEARETD